MIQKDLPKNKLFNSYIIIFSLIIFSCLILNSCKHDDDGAGGPGEECPEGWYYAAVIGDCEAAGVCTEKPSDCPDTWEPVCGCDGQTHTSMCQSAADGINLLHEGECLPNSCETDEDIPLNFPDYYCHKSVGDCNGTGEPIQKSTECPYITKPDYWDPVCGCDNRTYPNACEASFNGLNAKSMGSCYCETNEDTHEDYYCAKDPGYCDGGGMPALKPADCSGPQDYVCGCDLETYENACEAAAAGVNVMHAGECRPGAVAIAIPVNGASVDDFPAVFEINYSGSIDPGNLNVTLIGNSTFDITSKFVIAEGTMTASFQTLEPVTYTMSVTGEDLFGSSINVIINFSVDPFIDFVIPLGSISIYPEKPEFEENVQVVFFIENKGTVESPGTIVDIVYPPDPGTPMSIDIPSIQPGEFFQFSNINISANMQDNIVVIVDPLNLVVESDETNNFGDHPIDPGTASWNDLFLRILDFNIEGIGRVRFQVELTNIGTKIIDYPRLRYIARDRVDNELMWPMGGGAGACKGEEFQSHLVIDFESLDPDKSHIGEYVADFSTMVNNNPGDYSGQYTMCVEAISSEFSFGDYTNSLYDWDSIAETDRHGADAMGNNHDSQDWDVKNSAFYPSDGELEIHSVDLLDEFAGSSSNVVMSINNLSYPDYGHAAVQLSAEGINGRDDLTSVTGSFNQILLGGKHASMQFPVPGGRLPVSPFVLLTVTIRSGQDGSGPVILEEQRLLPLKYSDIGVQGIGVIPAEAYAHPVVSGGDPYQVTLYLSNSGLEPVETGVSAYILSPGQYAGALTSVNTSPVILPPDSITPFKFAWSPSSAVAHTIQGVVSTTSNLTPGTGNDDQLQRTFTVSPDPKIYVVAAEPYAGQYDNSVSPDPIDLRLRLYDKLNTNPDTQDEPEHEFLLEVYDELQEEIIISDTTTAPSSLVWREYTWTPDRAGYHDLSVRINGVEQFRHRYDIAPVLESDETDTSLIAWDDKYHRAGGYESPYRLFTLADSVIAGGDHSGISGAKFEKLTVIDGTQDETNAYLVRIKVNLDFAGVVQSAKYMYADSYYRAGVGMGVKTPESCWDREICGNGFLVHKTLWYKDTGGCGVGALIQAANETLISESIGALVDLRWGAKGSTVLAAVGVVLELGIFAYDAGNCDDGVNVEGDENGNAYITVPVINTRAYHLYIMLESRAATAAIVGDAWAYVDFYDYPFAMGCGGTRRGINIGYVSNELYPFPR